MAYKQKSAIPIKEGGTNATSMATNYGTVYYDGTRLVTTATGVAGQVLTSNGVGVAPSYQNATGGSILTATVVLTSAQVKNLFATPVEIIPAPAAGSFIKIIWITGKLTYGGSNVFTAGAAQIIDLGYDATYNIGRVMSNGGIVAAVNTTYQATLASVGAQDASNLEGRPVEAYNPVAVEIAGNAANDNTITVSVNYQIVTI